jgi:hypothetical protein
MLIFPAVDSNPAERLDDLNSSPVIVNLTTMYQRNIGGIQMTPAERERAAAYLAETRENLVCSTRNLWRAQLQFKPAPDRWSHDELLSEFDAARKRTCDFVVSTNAPLREHGYPHPLFGQFDCYQWLLAIGGHGERYRAQAEEVMAGGDFPHLSLPHLNTGM